MSKDFFEAIKEVDKELFDAINCDYANNNNERNLYEGDIRNHPLSKSVIDALIKWYQARYEDLQERCGICSNHVDKCNCTKTGRR